MNTSAVSSTRSGQVQQVSQPVRHIQQAAAIQQGSHQEKPEGKVLPASQQPKAGPRGSNIDIVA